MAGSAGMPFRDRVAPGLVAVAIATVAMVGIHAQRDLSRADMEGQGFLALLAEYLWDLIHWTFGGLGVDIVHPVDVLSAIPLTLIMAVSSLIFAIALAFTLAALEYRWRHRLASKWPGTLVSLHSYFPAIMLGFAFFIFYSRVVNPGELAFGSTSPIPPWGKLVITAGVLSIGNGIFQDLKDGISHDIENCMREDHIIAARARGERISPYLTRSLGAPLVTRAFSKVPVFIGAAIPFEFIFEIEGVGVRAFLYVERWWIEADGTPYPLVFLLCMLGVISILSSFVGDVVRLSLDPRQRDLVADDV
jgi:ABC-type dipeptide/oligopeptide/nickel transport system permease component